MHSDISIEDDVIDLNNKVGQSSFLLSLFDLSKCQKSKYPLMQFVLWYYDPLFGSVLTLISLKLGYFTYCLLQPFSLSHASRSSCGPGRQWGCEGVKTNGSQGEHCSNTQFCSLQFQWHGGLFKCISWHFYLEIEKHKLWKIIKRLGCVFRNLEVLYTTFS